MIFKTLFPMRRPKAQPKDTRLPRLHDATPPHHDSALTNEHRHRGKSAPRLARGKHFRLRDVNAR
jgi:hypothetical protein